MSLGVSIIVCTYNGANRLQRTLVSILNQIATSPFDLVIVDNNSTDETRDFTEAFLRYSNIDWKLVQERQPGLSNARWRGIIEAKYELILFCDDDNHLERDYLQKGIKFFEKHPKVGILGGLGKPVFEVKKPDWFDKFAHSYAIGNLGKKKGVQEKGSYHYGAACFFRWIPLMKLREMGFKSVLPDRKGRGLSSGGDVELCYAVQLLGYDLAFEPALRFDHFIENHRLEWDYYLRLKRGIAESFPLLESYKITQFESVFSFRFYLWGRLFVILKGIIKIFPARNKSMTNKMSYVVLIEKLKVFSSNYQGAIEAFKRNKEIFNA